VQKFGVVRSASEAKQVANNLHAQVSDGGIAAVFSSPSSGSQR
jgi:hypothetical protein